MNRGEIVRQVAQKTGSTMGTVDPVLGAFFDVVAEALLEGEIISLRGFGSFQLRMRGPVTRVNPQTREPMKIPERFSVAFITSEPLRNRLNGVAS